MKKLIILAGIIIAIIAVLVAQGAMAQTSKSVTMKMNAGIITKKLNETKTFYTTVLGFGITFENEFYVLMHTPDEQAHISFLLPDHPTQKPIFQPAFPGKGVYLTIEVEDVDEEYKRIKALNIPVEVDLRTEPWGDKHFAIVDPNGVGIDIVTYTSPGK